MSGAPAVRQTAAARTCVPLVPWLLIAATPIIFAAATWNDLAGSDQGQAAVRLFGAPVIAVELCILLVALHQGWRPIYAFLSLSLSVRLLLTALVITIFSTALLAPRPPSALIWSYISLVHLLFGFAVVFLVSRAGESEKRVIWPCIVAGLCGYALMLSIFVNSPHSQDFDWRYLGLGVSNVRQLGFYSVIGTAAALGLAIHRDGRETWLWVAAGALMLSIAFWSGSRGALLALPAAIGVTATFLRTMRTARSAVLIAATGGLAFGLSFLQLPPDRHYGLSRLARSINGASINDLSSQRADMWLDAWNAILNRPLFGYGAGQVGWVIPQPQGIFLHPHNFPLQLLFQWGIAGTAMVVVLALLLVRSSREAATQGAAELIPATLVVLSLATFSLYDGALFHTYPVMMFALAVAVMTGSSGIASQTAGVSK